MKALLLEIKADVDQAKRDGLAALPDERQAVFSARYDEIVSRAMQAEAGEPLPERGTEAGEKQSKAMNLLVRVSRYKEETLCFISDLAVKFTLISHEIS